MQTSYLARCSAQHTHVCLQPRMRQGNSHHPAELGQPEGRCTSWGLRSGCSSAPSSSASRARARRQAPAASRSCTASGAPRRPAPRHSPTSRNLLLTTSLHGEMACQLCCWQESTQSHNRWDPCKSGKRSSCAQMPHDLVVFAALEPNARTSVMPRLCTCAATHTQEHVCNHRQDWHIAEEGRQLTAALQQGRGPPPAGGASLRGPVASACTRAGSSTACRSKPSCSSAENRLPRKGPSRSPSFPAAAATCCSACSAWLDSQAA